MKIFVTGGNGFLGTSLCAKLIAQGNEVVAPGSGECNLTNATNLKQFSHEKFDQIFHLAAWTQAGDFCLYHPGEQWIINQQINTNLLNWWHCYQPQAKLIFMGTSCAYAPAADLSENNYMNGEPIDSLYTYAMTKRMLFQGARALGKQYGYKWNCFVPSTLYGPRYHTDGRQMHFIFDLIRKIIRAKEYNETVTLWGNGYQKREIVFTDDFIDVLFTINNLTSNEIFNIGAGVEYSIRDFANQISSIVGYDPSLIRYDETRYVGAESKCLSIMKVLDIVPQYSKMLTPLEVGLQQTIEWFYEAKAY